MMFVTLLTVQFMILQYGSKANDINMSNNEVCPTPLCDVYCPYGHVLDDKGCKTCNCIDPCTGIKCSIGNVCKAEPLFCISPPCGFNASCVPECPLRKCVSNCDYGYKLDDNGCRSCECIDHCKNKICAKGEICVLDKLCPFGTCGIRPKCIKKCPSLECHLTAKCAYGFEEDCDNCPTCACKNPCGGVICPKNEYCHVEVLQCLVAPCPPPRPVCTPYCSNSSPLLGLGHSPVQCSNTPSEVICPTGYACTKDPYLRLSYCCSVTS